MKEYIQPVTRRDFLKTSLAGGMVIATAPLWNLYSFASPPPDFHINPACNLSKDVLKKLLEIALKRGGEFAEVYVEYTVSNSIALEENKIKTAKRGLDMGVGIRVLHGEKTGYAFSDDLNITQLQKTAEVASFIASGSKVIKPVPLKHNKVPSYYRVKISPESIVPEEKAKLMMKANTFTRAYDKHIHQVDVYFSDINKKIMIANSNGMWVDDLQTYSGLYIYAKASKGDKKSSILAYKSGTQGFESFDTESIKKVSNEAGRKAIAMLPAEDAPAGEYPIVMAPGDCGLFFHEAIGHSLEGDGIRKKTSCFWDKKGKKIASDLVSLVDNGALSGARGTVNVDDEGTPGQNTLLIDKGKCVNFLYDNLNAKLMKTKSTGNGRRESYQYFPIPRMTNTYLLSGKDDPDEILKSVKNGIFVADVYSGNVFPTTGRFVFTVSEAYLIEEGKISKPLKGIQLMGNGQDVLKKIVMVGHDKAMVCGGTCGKDGQSKPVSLGNPTLKVSSITIGGSKV